MGPGACALVVGTAELEVSGSLQRSARVCIASRCGNFANKLRPYRRAPPALGHGLMENRSTLMVDHPLLGSRRRLAATTERQITVGRDKCGPRRATAPLIGGFLRPLPEGKVRTRLCAGGGSLQRTRLWSPIPWLLGKNTGNLSRIATGTLLILRDIKDLPIEFPSS